MFKYKVAYLCVVWWWWRFVFTVDWLRCDLALSRIDKEEKNLLYALSMAKMNEEKIDSQRC